MLLTPARRVVSIIPYYYTICLYHQTASNIVMSASSSEPSSSPLKRKRGETGDENSPRRACLAEPKSLSPLTLPHHLLSSVFPIFEKRGAGDGEAEQKPFRWLTPSLGPSRSCLHGVHLAPTASSRVAAFDLDGTVIKSPYTLNQVGRKGSKGGGTKRMFQKTAHGLEWEWWKAVVPQRLKEVHDSG
jgi:hypothetical protein